jgi:hypothetical protein
MSEEPRTDEELEEFVKQIRIRDQRNAVKNELWITNQRS